MWGIFGSSQNWDHCCNLWMECLGGRNAPHCDPQLLNNHGQYEKGVTSLSWYSLSCQPCHCDWDVPSNGLSFRIKPNLRRLLWALDDLSFGGRRNTHCKSRLLRANVVYGDDVSILLWHSLTCHHATVLQKCQSLDGHFWSSQIWDNCCGLWMMFWCGRKAIHSGSQLWENHWRCEKDAASLLWHPLACQHSWHCATKQQNSNGYEAIFDQAKSETPVEIFEWCV